MALQCPESYGIGPIIDRHTRLCICKFELYIFKIAQVISENVRIAFLYVLSIHYAQISLHPNIHFFNAQQRAYQSLLTNFLV